MTRVAVIQMVSTDHVSENLETASELINAASKEGAAFILLPENFAFMGKEEQDKLNTSEPAGEGPIQDFLSQQAKTHNIWLCGGTIPMATSAPDKITATSLIVDPQGKLFARYDKIHLFDVCVDNGDESYQESSTFVPGDEIVVARTPFANIGMSVCYDLRFPELYRKMHDQQVNLIITPSAFTYTTGKSHWESLLKVRAVENLSYVMASSQGGLHVNDRKTWGHSMIVSPWGEVLACVDSGPGFACADLDMQTLETLRKNFPALEHRKIDTYDVKR